MAQEQLVRSLYEAINTHNLQKFVSMFTDDGQFTDISSGKVYRGKDEIRGMMAGWLKAFPDVKINVSNILGSGDVYSVEFSVNGTHMGPLGEGENEIPASGKKINVPSVDVIHLKKEKIQSLNCYLAATIMMEQIGAMPSHRPSDRSAEQSRQSLM